MCLTTVGREGRAVRESIQRQEEEEASVHCAGSWKNHGLGGTLESLGWMLGFFFPMRGNFDPIKKKNLSNDSLTCCAAWTTYRCTMIPPALVDGHLGVSHYPFFRIVFSAMRILHLLCICFRVDRINLYRQMETLLLLFPPWSCAARETWLNFHPAQCLPLGPEFPPQVGLWILLGSKMAARMRGWQPLKFTLGKDMNIPPPYWPALPPSYFFSFFCTRD